MRSGKPLAVKPNPYRKLEFLDPGCKSLKPHALWHGLASSPSRIERVLKSRRRGRYIKKNLITKSRTPDTNARTSNPKHQQNPTPEPMPNPVTLLTLTSNTSTLRLRVCFPYYFKTSSSKPNPETVEPTSSHFFPLSWLYHQPWNHPCTQTGIQPDVASRSRILIRSFLGCRFLGSVALWRWVKS